MVCDYCGKEIDEKSPYCQFCGHNVIPWCLEAGSKLHHGRYEIVQSLGAGGMATVYLAEDLNLDNTPCVIKVMTDAFKDSHERDYAINKFKDEAVMLARLRHPNLPVVQNHFLEEGRYFLVMDYIEGENLDDMLYDALEDDCLLAEEVVVDWGVQICDVLHYLHCRDPMIIHRDVKPENLMEQSDGRIMLLDFGVAHISKKRETGTLVGTPGYASPEQYLGKAYPQSDIFALGVSLHRLLTGFDPAEEAQEGSKRGLFSYPRLNEFRDDLAPGLQDVISRALKMEVDERFVTAKEFKEALQKIKEKPEAAKTEIKPRKRTGRTGSLAVSIQKKIGQRAPTKPAEPEVKTPIFSEIFKIKTSKNLPELKQRLSEIVALDIGTHAIKLLQLDVDGNRHVYPKLIKTVKTPPKTVSGGMIVDPKALGKGVMEVMEGLNGVEVIASLSPYCTSVRTIKMPVTSPVKLPAVLSKSDLSQLFPIPVEECHIQYEILAPVAEDDEKNMKVRISATRKDAVENLIKTLNSAKLNSDKIASEPFVLANLADYMIHIGNRKKNLAIINMGAEGTALALVRDQVLSQTAVFPHGGKHLTQALMQTERVKFSDAEKLKSTECDADMWGKTTGTNLFQVLMPHIKDWITEILKALRYFGPDYRFNKFNSIVFCGGGIELKNLQKHLNSQLKISSDKFPLPRSKAVSMDEQLILEQEPAMMTAMGLILTEFMEFPYLKFELPKPKKKSFFSSLFGI